MGKTFIHKQKAKFKPGDKMTVKLKNHFDRYNGNEGEFRNERNKIKYKLKKEDYEK